MRLGRAKHVAEPVVGRLLSRQPASARGHRAVRQQRRIAAIVQKPLIFQSGQLRPAGQLKLLGRLRQSVISIEGNAGFIAGLTALGGDEHHAVGPARAVNGRGVGILQDFHALDVRRVQVGQRVARHLIAQARRNQVGVVDEHPVHHVKRVVAGIHRVAAPDADENAPARHPRIGRYLHAGHFALQQLVGAGGRNIFQLVTLHRTDGAGQRFAILLAVARHHHFGKLLQIRGKVDGERARSGRYFFRGVAYVSEYECTAGRNRKRKLAVGVGGGAHGAALGQHRYARQRRVAGRVGDGAAHDGGRVRLGITGGGGPAP